MNQLGKVLSEVAKYVPRLLKTELSKSLVFHNLNHTLEVVQASAEIGSHCDFTAEQMNIVQVAAWFHDCGYTQAYTGHENISKDIATGFLCGIGYPQEFLDCVVNCIEATRYPQKPIGVESRALCDADLYHFTRPDYHRYEEALRVEFERYFDKHPTDAIWAQTNCDMLTAHHYHTDYGREVLQKFKEINLERMRCKYL
ncbi:MAG: HD domain-containing protein [Bacteroidota bacterium]